jgi:hypothetical protein
VCDEETQMKLKLEIGQKYVLNDKGGFVTFTKAAPEQDVSDEAAEKLLEETVPTYDREGAKSLDVKRFSVAGDAKKGARPAAGAKAEGK